VAEVTEKVLVPFSGEGTGSGGLSWGQQTIWREFEATGAPIWLTGMRPRRPGWTVEAEADEVAFMIGRNQSLRTRLIVDPGQPVRQVLYDRGELHLQVIDTEDSEDPLLVAKDLEERWKDHELVYDFGNDWPVRMALIRHRGKPAYYVRATSHIVTDGYGALAMYQDLRARDPVTGRPSGPITAMEPLEQARWQASPAGRRRSHMSEQYWERVLRDIPTRRFGKPADPADEQFGRMIFDSRAAFLAVQAIAARTGVATAPVLLAAVAVAMARATGVNPLVPRLYVSNRFRPRLATTVSPISQTCPCPVDVAGASFDEAVKRAYYASLVAYKNAYFEPVKIRELVASVSEERGEPMDLAFLYNDVRIDSPRDAVGSVPSRQEIQEALPLTKITFQAKPRLEGHCSIMFENSPDTINMMMAVNAQYLGLDQVREFLRELEAVVVCAAFDPAVPTGL
jgi:Condensation domain